MCQPRSCCPGCGSTTSNGPARPSAAPQPGRASRAVRRQAPPSLTVVSSAKDSGARSMKRRFQSSSGAPRTPWHHVRLQLRRVPPSRHDHLLRVCPGSTLSSVAPGGQLHNGQARPPPPRTLRLNAPHRPLRRARTPRRSRLGLPSRTVPPKSHHAGSSRSGPGAGSSPSRWDRAPVRVHRRCMSAPPAPELNCCSAFPCPNAGEPLASESTRRESPIVPERSRSCQDVSTSADAAATGAKKHPATSRESAARQSVAS